MEYLKEEELIHHVIKKKKLLKATKKNNIGYNNYLLQGIHIWAIIKGSNIDLFSTHNVKRTHRNILIP